MYKIGCENNKRHFPAGPYGATHIVSAGELLERITPEII
jgi:hypothetical protein